MENVELKLSGLPAETAPHHDGPSPYRPWLERALDTFGPDRSIFGSDWPVSAAGGLTYEEWRAEVEGAIGTGAGHDAVFAGTATRVYQLGAAHGNT